MDHERIKAITKFIICCEYEKLETWNLLEYSFFAIFWNLLKFFFNRLGDMQKTQQLTCSKP